MLVQAAGLALLSALSPTALLIAAVYLGSARPGLTSLSYLAGAALMSFVMGVVVLLALRSAGLNHPGQHAARYGLRLGLGILFVAALQVIATARAGPDLTVLAVILVVVINVLLVWLPIMLHLVAPRATEKHLKAFNTWLRANGRAVLVGVLAVAGGIMVFDGLYGFITGA